MFTTIFNKYLVILEKNIKDSNIYTKYLNKMNSNYVKNTSNARIIIDYIAGMTDDYFIEEYNYLKKLKNPN